MKKTFVLFPLALLAVAACSENPAGLDDSVYSAELVITKGVEAPATPVAPRGPAFSTLAADAILSGSHTTPVSLNGQSCSTFPSQQVTITYRVTGNQRADESFKVNTKWIYDGSSFIGSVPQTVSVPARRPQDAETVRQVVITIENGTTAGTGVTSFAIVPFDNTRNDNPNIVVDGGIVTVHVAFADCTTPNTAPWLTVPADFRVEATSAAGAVVDYADLVKHGDAEDALADLSLTCTPASGGVFGLGTTTVSCTVEDSEGLTATETFDVTVEDTTAPEFTNFPVGTLNRVATNASGWAFDVSGFGITAADVNGVSEPVTISCTPANGTVYAIGITIPVSCTTEDAAGNESAASTFKVFVTLDLSDINGELLSPLRMAAPFTAHKLNSTIPHKLRAPKYADGTRATGLALTLKVVRIAGITPGAVEIDGNDYSAGSTSWRYDADEEHYIFNLKTGNKSPWVEGTWSTTVSFAGIQLAQTQFELRK